MALIKCPECGKEISDMSNICIHCGYPLKDMTSEDVMSKKITQNSNGQTHKILFFGMIALLVIVLLFSILTRSQPKPTNPPTEETCTEESQNSDSSAISQSKANLKPYFDVLGVKTKNNNLTVSQEFLANLSSLEFMGYLGTIEHGYSEPNCDFVDIMDWVSNAEISEKDYGHFIQSLNQYFDSEADLKSYDNLSKETYHWVDYDELCMVYCWYNNGAVCVRWHLKEELVSSLTKATLPQTTFSANTPLTATSSKVCTECGKSATYAYKNPFSGKLEDYCYTHYKEIKDIMSMMEEDVGRSNQSKHTCEQCSREGTHRYNSFTGQTEYYCTTHYEELMDMLESMGLK